jgi:predicted CXXCH cytochrome family protein
MGLLVIKQCMSRGVRPARRMWQPLPVAVILGALLLCGCDPVTRHQALTTLFDGVPRMPPAKEFCQEELAREAKAAQSGSAPTEKAGEAAPPKLLNHAPYAEKKCPDCHGNDKDKEGGLVVPRLELCAVCHPNFLTGAFQHGPAAVGDCLACHEPHQSTHPPLLVAEKSVLCTRCHHEDRSAKEMHERFRDKGISCVQCHDPHAGNDRFFLK